MTKPIGLIVLDGPNAAGKSTLAKHLVDTYGAKHLHCVYRFKDKMYAYHLATLRRAIRLAQSNLVIVDRNWASECIYGEVFRNGTQWPHQGRLLQKLLLKHAALQVYCLLSPAKAVEAVTKHRQDYHSPQFVQEAARVEEVARLYTALARGSREATTRERTYLSDLASQGGATRNKLCVSVYEIDKQGQDLSAYGKTLLANLEQVQTAQYQPALQDANRNIAGHLQLATHLMVGDQVNHANYRRVWPFMAYGGSSLYMAEIMSRYGCREENYMWTNADCPEWHIDALVALKPSLRIVTLGGVAARVLSRSGHSYTAVYHPSYALRWGEAVKAAYPTAFKAAVGA